MLNKTFIMLTLLAVTLAIPACNKSQVVYDDGPDRTIRTQPLRDSAKGEQAVQRGLAYLDDGELDKAEQQFRRAIKADPKSFKAFNNLGLVYYLQSTTGEHRDRLYEAAQSFKQARDLNPSLPEPYNNIGMAYEAKYMLDRAVEFYREAIKRAPKNTLYVGNLARALISRGDRTAEVAALLDQILADDNRPDWVIWAKSQRATIRP